MTSDRRNWPTPIVFDPNNPAIMYYGGKTDQVWRTTNGGSGGRAISGDLPDAPVNAIVPDSVTPAKLYVARTWASS